MTRCPECSYDPCACSTTDAAVEALLEDRHYDTGYDPRESYGTEE